MSQFNRDRLGSSSNTKLYSGSSYRVSPDENGDLRTGWLHELASKREWRAFSSCMSKGEERLRRAHAHLTERYDVLLTRINPKSEMSQKLTQQLDKNRLEIEICESEKTLTKLRMSNKNSLRRWTVGSMTGVTFQTSRMDGGTRLFECRLRWEGAHWKWNSVDIVDISPLILPRELKIPLFTTLWRSLFYFSLGHLSSRQFFELLTLFVNCGFHIQDFHCLEHRNKFAHKITMTPRIEPFPATRSSWSLGWVLPMCGLVFLLTSPQHMRIVFCENWCVRTMLSHEWHFQFFCAHCSWCPWTPCHSDRYNKFFSTGERWRASFSTTRCNFSLCWELVDILDLTSGHGESDLEVARTLQVALPDNVCPLRCFSFVVVTWVKPVHGTDCARAQSTFQSPIRRSSSASKCRSSPSDNVNVLEW